MYHRIDMGTPGTTGTPPRSSPFDLSVTVFDAENNTIQHRPEVAIALDPTLALCALIIKQPCAQL